jgi:phosphoserine phosphatase RsbU/P
VPLSREPEARDAFLIRKLNSLLEISKALGAEIRLEPLLADILKKASEVTEAERTSFFTYDEATRTLSIRVSEDLARGQLRVPLGVGIAGYVAETLEPLNVPDAYADPRFNAQSDRESGFVTRSILCAPVLTHAGRLIGVIQVLNKIGEISFTADDESLLAAFASIAGIALDRARLVEAFVEKQKIESSLLLAHDIQMGMLPRRFPRRPEIEVFGTLRPARSVGGDFYDFRLDGEKLWFVVGDVSGKGIPAALFMAVTKVLFGASIEGASSPSAVMSHVNRELYRGNTESLFVTVFLGRLDISTGELLYTNAGHNPPYRLRKDGGVEVVAAHAGLVLGVREDHAYRTESLRLTPGDGVYVYTDGVSEALNGEGEAFSEARLEAALARAPGRDVARVVGDSLSALDEFVGSAPQFDDITVLAIRYLAG